MVAAAIKGFQRDQFEIRPGQANQLKFMSRVAPEFILKQLSRPVERMLASVKRLRSPLKEKIQAAFYCRRFGRQRRFEQSLPGLSG